MVHPPAAEARKRRILEVLAGRPEGMPRGELQELAGLQGLDPQVVRRLLADLLRRGSLRVEGVTRRRRYFLGQHAVVPANARAGWGGPQAVEDDLPLSPEGGACRNLLARPLYQRPPVSYRREFLDAYRPGETFYLSEALRRRMASLGGSGRPAGPEQAFRQQLIDLSWNSARLEGNTYAFPEAERLIERGEAAAGRGLQETQMILNHMAALQYLLEAVEPTTPEPGTVQNLHAFLMENLLPNPLDEGRLRVTPKGIRGSAYLPTAVPQAVDEGFRQLLRIASGIEDPFEQSFFLLVHIPYLQPFLNGNRRTARLAANIPLLIRKCVPITFSGVGAAAFADGMLAVCELNRIDLLRDLYVFAYERACASYSAVRTSVGEPDPFRLRYRSAIKNMVREVVLAGPSSGDADVRIRAYAESTLPKEARLRIRSLVETELAGLHEGNLARYQLRLSEFSRWQRGTQAPETGE